MMDHFCYVSKLKNAEGNRTRAGLAAPSAVGGPAKRVALTLVLKDCTKPAPTTANVGMAKAGT
jgi:hypothetical protein